MRDERARRRSRFRPGIDLRLADGQVWSLPLPSGPLGEGDSALFHEGSESTWDDRNYAAIVRAALEAEDEGDVFRARLALAIHLLNWNYDLDADDFEDLLDDHGESRRRADLSRALNRLALAHLRPFTLTAMGDSGRFFDPAQDDFRRVIGHEPSLILGRRGPREVGGSVDLTS
jgi:hypothetical protein